MATITTAGNGNWSSTTNNAPWPGGTLPTNADAVVIAQDHTVTVDNAAVCLSLTMTGGAVGHVGAILNNATGADISLTVQNGVSNPAILATVGSTRNPSINFDMSADPTHTFTVIWNNALNTTSPNCAFSSTGQLNLKGATRTRWTTTTGAITGNSSLGCSVTDATGWRVGDQLVFATTKPINFSVGGFTISGWTYAAGFLTFTCNSTASLVKGSRVLISGLTSTDINGRSYTVDTVVDGTHFKVAKGGAAGAPTGVTSTGTMWLGPLIDIVTIATIVGNAITWTDGGGTGGAVAFDHASGAVVANMTSNLRFPTANYGSASFFLVQNGYAPAASQVIDQCEFRALGGTGGFNQNQFMVTSLSGGFSSISNNAFFDATMNFSQIASSAAVTRTNNTFVCGYFATAVVHAQGTGTFGPETNLVVLHAANGFGSGSNAISLVTPQISGCTNALNSSGAGAAFNVNSTGFTVTGGDFWSNYYIAGGTPGAINPYATITGATIGTKYSGAINQFVTQSGGDGQVEIISCPLDTTGFSLVGTGITTAAPTNTAFFRNKGNDTNVQELYTKQSSTVPAVQREYVTSPQKFTRATSSMLQTSSISTAITQTQSLVAENGVALTVVGYMVTSHAPSATAYGASTLPSMALSDLGVSTSATYVDVSTGAISLAANAVSGAGTSTFTRASGSFVTDGFVVGDSILAENFATTGNNGTKTVIAVSALTLTIAEALTSDVSAANRALTRWYKATLTATQSSGADGTLTLTYTSQSAVAGAKAWFSGVPNAPYSTRARHYGYLFDETVPTRTSNVTVSASEATAQAYTGMAVTWGTSSSSVAITADTTFQKLYDYTQAQGCLNVASAMPVTGAGVAGSPSLFAAGNITISTTKKMNGSGSISMGSNVLTTEFASGLHPAYTYTGGTWSQATTVPTFSSGTLAIAGEGTYSFVCTSPIITFAPTAGSVTYDLSGITATGTLDLRNTHATRAITVQLPSGTSYTTASNTGAAITVSLPSVYQSVTISGATAGSRIQIYDSTSSTELYNGTPVFPYTWTDTVAASATRAIRLRVAYVTAATANDFIDTNIGTCGTTSPSNAVSYLVSPTVDDVYVSNAIDGTTITDCAITGTTLHVDINAGATTWQHIYAFMSYWLFTSGGIKDQYLEMTATDQTHYVFATAHGSFKIKNVSSPTAPLVVTGGNAAPDSGSVVDILDTTGGSIFCIEGTVVAFSTSDQAVNLATVQAGLTAQGLTTTRAPYLDKLPAIANGVSALQ